MSNKVMRVFELLHKMIKKSSSKLHTKRVQALLNAAFSLMVGKRLTLTGLARSMKGACKPKSAIRKLDYLLGNTHLHKERHLYYRCLASQILSGVQRPVISIDWTGAPYHKNYCLRASINVKGRSFVLFEEVHPRKLEKNTSVNRQFLERLKGVLPSHVKPIILTDAAFRVPWCRKILELGWDYITRVRNDNSYFDFESNSWKKTYSLYCKATDKACFVGKVLLTKKTQLQSSLYLFRGKNQGRKRLTKTNKRSKRTHSKVQSKAHRDPLLLSTSLPHDGYTAKQIINVYQKRMEIEEEFRDLKSPRYGFGLKFSGTRSAERLQVLLLIALLASFICWLIALTLKRNNLHYDYQANTIKNRDVLSIQYLACEAYRRLGDTFKLTKQDVIDSINQIKSYIKIVQYG